MTLTLITALAVILIRIGLFHAGHPAEGTDFMFVHFMALVTIVFFTGKRSLEQDPSINIILLVRDGFKNAAVYALLMGIFLYIYYNTVEDGYFAMRVNEMVAVGVGEGQPEDVIRPRLEKFFTPFNYASMTFFLLLIAGGVNAFLIGLLHHKVLRKVMR
jgi:hypothetical protein